MTAVGPWCNTVIIGFESPVLFCSLEAEPHQSLDRSTEDTSTPRVPEKQRLKCCFTENQYKQGPYQLS